MHPADILIALRFLSRLPVPVTRREIERGVRGFVGSAALVPVAGAIIGFFPAAVLIGAMAFGLPSLLAAPVAVTCAVFVTGALHEDGLADCADGFGGGRTRDRKLDIMRDSRIGTYGACAIGLSLYLRAMAIGLVAARSPAFGAAVIVAAAAVSRALCLMPLAWLPPARRDGLGAGSRPVAASVLFAFGLAIVAAFVALGWAVSPARIGLGLGSATATAWIVCLIARRQIGGQTGDVAGATQQLAELGFILIFAAA